MAGKGASLARRESRWSCLETWSVSREKDGVEGAGVLVSCSLGQEAVGIKYSVIIIHAQKGGTHGWGKQTGSGVFGSDNEWYLPEKWKVWAKTVQNLTLAWWPGLAGRVTGFAVAMGLEPTHRQQQPR